MIDGSTFLRSPQHRRRYDAPKTPDTPGRADGAKSAATARDFLARKLGMTDMVAGPFRFTGTGTGEVGFRHKYGEGRRLLPETGPYAVVVRLQRLPAGWWVIQATAVRVQFTAATPAPRILEVTTNPKLRTLEGGFWLELPQGEGKVVFSVKAFGIAH